MAHVPRDHAHHPQSTGNGVRENSERLRESILGRMEIVSEKSPFSLVVLRYYAVLTSC